MATASSKYGLLGRLNPEDLYNAFLGLEQRSQVFIGIGAFFLFIALIVTPISCATSRLSNLEQTYDKGNEVQRDIMAKIGRYQSMKATLEERRRSMSASGATLTTTVESIAKEVGIGDKIEQLKPINLSNSDYYDEEGVDAVINALTLGQLIDFLSKIENNPNLPIKVSKLQIKPRFRKRQELTATLQLSTIKLKEAAGE